jgi:hypothetical protein
VKAAKSQQILPSDRKHVDLVGIGAHKKEVSQSFSQPLQRLAEDALGRLTRVRRLAARPRTVAKIRVMPPRLA